MANEQRPTIKSLADTLGLSKGTVSKALNGREDVSEQTRNEVLALAKATGYRLQAKHWIRTVGVVLNPEQGFNNPTLSDFLVGISAQLEKSGFDLLVSHAQSDTDTAAFSRLINHGKADGFILMRTRQDDARVNWLLENRVPFVTHGRTKLAQRHAWFDMDGAWATQLAFAHLSDLGHKSIAYVASPQCYAYTADRLNGVPAGVKTIHASPDEQGGFGAASTLFGDADPPTAVVCSMDAQAVGVAHFLRLRNIRIGSEVSIIGYDDVPFANAMQPKLTTFSQSARSAGERCASMLLALLDDAPARQLQVLERPEPRFRGSSASPQLSSAQLRIKLGYTAQSSLGDNKNDV